MRIKERLKRKYRIINEETEKIGVWHSISYHNHFDGYAEYRIPGRNGKPGRIRRLYVAEYYGQELKPFQRIGLRLLYGGLFLGGAGSCMHAACLPVESNRSWYVNLPQALALPCLFWLLTALLCYIVSPCKIQRRRYKFILGGMGKGAFFSGILMVLTAGSTLIYGCRHLENSGLHTGFTAGLFLMAGLQILALYFIEGKIEYQVIENEVSEPPGSVVL
ncbi:MAG: hypothetical protein LIP16_21840 [Clostridium sp.]|nr:hypothetical protein [Clostridium sp.]